jgi:hypothetical protein
MGGRGRRKPGQMASGEMHAHHLHQASTIERSADGRCAVISSTAVDTSAAGPPSWHVEDVTAAQALEGPDFSYLLGDEGGWAAQPTAEDLEPEDGITMAPPPELPQQGNYERWENTVSRD